VESGFCVNFDDAGIYTLAVRGARKISIVRQWEGEGETGAVTYGAFNRDTPTQAFHDLPCHIQPESRPLARLLGGKKRFEYFFQIIA
jgi:hypothetical protein